MGALTTHVATTCLGMHTLSASCLLTGDNNLFKVIHIRHKETAQIPSILVTKHL